MTTVIERLKEKLRVEDVVAKYVTLKKAGRSQKGLCPFHTEATPSFFVFADSQRWHCFGCGIGGDVIDFVMQYQKWDMTQTIRDLAREAGVEIHESPEQRAAREIKRTREAIFAAAAGFFHARLLESPDALHYLREVRKISDEVIRDYKIGFFGEDWGQLRAALLRAEVDIEQPAAVALVGYRGDVAAWGQRHGIAVDGQWVQDSKIPAMRPQMIVFPHWRKGRVAYISGRMLPPYDEGAKSWNPQRALVGEKQPFYNLLFDARDETLPRVVVEGQMCALSLQAWGLPGVALAGCELARAQDSASAEALTSLVKAVGKKGGLVLGLDDDDAGRTMLRSDDVHGRVGLADALLKQEFQPTRLRVLVWPGKDANGALQQGLGTAAIKSLVKQSPTWIDYLVALAHPEGEEPDEDLVREVFAALTHVEPFEVSRMRERLAEALGIRRQEFDGLLRIARREAGQAEDGKPRYMIVGGRNCHRYYDRIGNEVLDPLANFQAQIVEEVLLDDGEDTHREFVLAGAQNSIPLPPARVPAQDFGAMGWVAKAWGAKAIVEAGAATKDHLRACIQYLSDEIKQQTVFTHTGWREIQGKRVFLTCAGSVPACDTPVTVELDPDLQLYNIPAEVGEAKTAMQASLEFLDVAPRAITWPIWAAMFLAPLRSLVTVAFVEWVFGPTGSMKSTLVALAMNHYGVAFDDKHLPGGFIDSGNRMEQKAFVTKDCPLVIDDYAPQKDRRSHQEYVNAAHRIIRAAGNLAGRGRLRSDATARRTYVPRSLVMITGEDLPTSEGVVGRLFVVEMSRGQVDKTRLTALQLKRGDLARAMAGYLTWCAEKWGWLTEQAPERWRKARQAAFQDGIHLRLPEAVAGLFLGAEMGLIYARESGAITPEQYTELRAEAWQVLVESASEQSQRAREEKPEHLFVGALAALLTGGQVFLEARNGGAPLGGPLEHAERLGWYDAQKIYLLPTAYNRVYQYYSERGDVFPVKESTLRKMLFEAGWLIKTGDGRYTDTLWQDNRTQRVIVLSKACLEFDKVDDAEE